MKQRNGHNTTKDGANNNGETTTTLRGRPKEETDRGNVFVSYVCTAIRFIGALCYIILATVGVYLTVPLQPFGGFVLRKFGFKYLPLDIATLLWARGFVRVVGSEPIVEISKKINTSEPTILMYSHASFYDPIVVGGYSPIPAKFIFKKELIFLFPPVLIAAWIAGHIPINRAKRNSAISALQEAAHAVIRTKRTIAISPEGTRSPDGTLQAFKKGPFHLAKDAEVKHVVPVVVFGAYELWPPGKLFPAAGTIRIHFLDPVSTANTTLESLSDKVRDAMVKEISRVDRLGLYPKLNASNSRKVEASLFAIFTFTLLAFAFRWWLYSFYLFK